MQRSYEQSSNYFHFQVHAFRLYLPFTYIYVSYINHLTQALYIYICIYPWLHALVLRFFSCTFIFLSIVFFYFSYFLFTVYLVFGPVLLGLFMFLSWFVRLFKEELSIVLGMACQPLLRAYLIENIFLLNVCSITSFQCQCAHYKKNNHH